MTMTSNLGRRVFRHGLVFTTAILTCAALQADHDTKGSADQKFVQKALTGGQMEVQMGQLAQQKGQSQDVKSLGATLVRDHTQANQKLQQLASSKNITVSQTELSSPAGELSTRSTTHSSPDKSGAHASVEHHAKAQKELSKLQNQTGQEFDKAFVRMAIKDHKKDISEFEHARSEVKDADLRTFIDETLPKLRQHLQLAQSAAKTVGVDASSIAVESDNDNDTAVGGAAAGTTGTRGSDKPSSPASNPDKDRSSLDHYNGATDADATGTVRHNNPRADLDANVGDHSVSASADLDKSDHSVSANVDTERKNKIFQKGDGKVLGLSTDKNDGKFLGIIPDPNKKERDANINADVDVNGHDASVGGSASTETGSSSNTK